MASSSSGDYPNYGGVLFRKWRSFLFRLRFGAERIRDKFTGVDFTAAVSKEKAGTEFLGGALRFESSAFVPELYKAIKFLNISSNDAILDYGSGKGGVLATFSKYPFRKISGIEVSEKLVEISRANLKKLKLSQIEVIQEDATRFRRIDDFNYFYFFNPFQGEIFEAVIRNIVESGERNPRKIGLIYYYPKCHDMIIETGKFHLKKEFKDGARLLRIYFNQ